MSCVIGLTDKGSKQNDLFSLYSQSCSEVTENRFPVHLHFISLPRLCTGLLRPSDFEDTRH